MSFGWWLILNGIVGLFVNRGFLLWCQWRAAKELGDQESEEAYDESMQSMYEENSYAYSIMYDQKMIPLMMALSTIITYLFWEIVLPISLNIWLRKFKDSVSRRKKDS